MASLDDQLARLPTLSIADLRSEWEALHRETAPRFPIELLRHALGHRLQEKASRRKALAISTMLSQTRAPTIKPGTRLLRTWNGRSIAVMATEHGFLFEDKQYRSLTAIARAVTGTNWSGPRFFGLTDHG